MVSCSGCSYCGDSSELLHRGYPLSCDLVYASLANGRLMFCELSLGQLFLVPASILILLHLLYVFEARSLEHLSLRKGGLAGPLENLLFDLIG